MLSAGLWAVVAGALLAGSAMAAQAQSTAGSDHGRVPAAAPATPPAAAPRWTFGGWVAGATGQPLETRLGHVYDRDLAITAVRAIHPLVTSRRFRLRSTVDLLPLVIATANRSYTVEMVPQCRGTTLCAAVVGNTLIPSQHTAYATGVAPLGFEGSVRGSRAERSTSTGASPTLARMDSRLLFIGLER